MVPCCYETACVTLCHASLRVLSASSCFAVGEDK
jgi:hypothetical protein